MNPSLPENTPDSRETTAPTVSVVMATYNYGQFIRQAIESVIQQTWTDWELVIIDDGSSDDTSSIVEPFRKDDRIHYHRQENRGQPKAKNAGIRLARGRFIAFLDADDAWHPEKLEKQLPLFERDAKVGVTYSGVTIMDEEGHHVEERSCKQLRGDVFKESLHQTIPPFSSTIVRREVFDDIGLFNEAIPLAIDFELWLRVAMRYHFDYIDEPLLYYRTGHANLSRRFRERRELVIRTILPHILDQCGGRDRLTRGELAEGYAKLFIGMAESDLPTSQRSAQYWALRACMARPTSFRPWKYLTRACIPHAVARFLKGVAGLR